MSAYSTLTVSRAATLAAIRSKLDSLSTVNLEFILLEVMGGLYNYSICEGKGEDDSLLTNLSQSDWND
jgi:hypothetical protein